jgi:predicted HTH transcriptional regulator
MRMNLKTNQTGKEIELAWLKGTTAFMNSEGGILLLGVDDSGEIVGLEADNFENEDRCMLHFKNLINQHIGAEFTHYLEFGLIDMNGKTIGILECKPSQKPVFLKNKSEEHFYIRSGPSSIKLQTSKILEYIEDRKN